MKGLLSVGGSIAKELDGNLCGQSACVAVSNLSGIMHSQCPSADNQQFVVLAFLLVLATSQRKPL